MNYLTLEELNNLKPGDKLIYIESDVSQVTGCKYPNIGDILTVESISKENITLKEIKRIPLSIGCGYSYKRFRLLEKRKPKNMKGEMHGWVI